MLSPFSFLIQTVQNISSLDPFHWFLFLYYELFFFLCFLHHLLFISEITPDSISHSLIVRLWVSAGGGLCCFGDLTFPSPFICPDLSLLISAMGSQLLMKSQPVLWAVTWSRVKRILASCSCFSVMSFNFQFIGLERVWGRGGCPFFSCFSHLKLYNLCSFLL